MAFLPIVPGVRRKPSAGNSLFSADPAKRKAQIKDTLEHDDHACRFCGFRAAHYQHVVPYAGNDGQALVTACGFCEQCLFLDRAGLSGGGVLVWLPEIGQAELNHIMRAVYVARAEEGGPLSAAAARAQDALMARRQEAKKRLGSDDPLLLATVMHEDLSDEDYGRAPQALDGIRLLPLDKYIVRGADGDTNQFPKLLAYWRSAEGPYAKLPAGTWADMFKAAQAAVGHA